jgi:hypothetical protein
MLDPFLLALCGLGRRTRLFESGTQIVLVQECLADDAPGFGFDPQRVPIVVRTVIGRDGGQGTAGVTLDAGTRGLMTEALVIATVIVPSHGERAAAQPTREE